MYKNSLIIATRQSTLALAQANLIKQRLESAYPLLRVTLLGLTTTGDKFLNRPLTQAGGKRLFVKELEQALLNGTADIAVHSMKDVPAEIPELLCIAAISEREDARDVFISNTYDTLAALPPNAIIGTSSLRRHCLLKALQPNWQIQPLRGNIDSRLQRLDTGQFDAIILAAAGLNRLHWQHRVRQWLATEDFLPAPGQGALGIECRSDNKEVLAIVSVLDNPITHSCIKAERQVNHKLGGSCQIPLGAYAYINKNRLYLQALIGYPDARLILRAQADAPTDQPEQLGERVANTLLAQGAKEILQTLTQNTFNND